MATTKTAQAVTPQPISAQPISAQTISAQPEPQQPRNLPAPLQIAQQLDKMKGKLADALPAHMKVEQFNRVVMTAVNNNNDLVAADRQSLFNSCVRCATDGLLPDGREAALVTFGGKVQYMPMVFGILKKLRQSGEIASVTARLVYKNEMDAGRFSFEISDGEERLTHHPMLMGERGEMVLAYATAKFKDGTVQNEVMTRADIEKVRNVSRSKNSGPWTVWYDEMSRKTVIRRLAKYLPLSAEDNRLRNLLREDAETTEFEEMKQDAIASAQPQSLDAARMLGAPEPETHAHDAETGEVIEAEAQQPDDYADMPLRTEG
jgi:recombination protein RecT